VGKHESGYDRAMRMTSLFGLCVALAACSGGSNGNDSGTDSSVTTDSGAGSDSSTLDSGADASTTDAGDDASTTDAGGDAATDAGGDAATDAATSDAATSDGGGDSSTPACAGMECAGFPSALERGCTLGADGADVNCAPELHQMDCCGTMRAMGMNHGIVGSDFCPAEATCRATYTTPAPCTAGPITLDTGETTDDPSLIHVRCNIPTDATTGTCETYLGDATGGPGSCG